MDEGGGRLRRGQDLERSLTLLRAFLLASAVILIAGGAVLGWALSRTLREQAVVSERWSLVRYVDGVVRPTLVRHDRVVVNRWGGKAILSSLTEQPDIVAVKVWKPDGRLAFTNFDRSRIGRRSRSKDRSRRLFATTRRARASSRCRMRAKRTEPRRPLASRASSRCTPRSWVRIPGK